MNKREFDSLPKTENLKSRLVSELAFRVRMIVSDCETFGRVRVDLHEWYDGASIGGGNFVMVLALFSLLNLLSKTFRFLVAPEEFVSEASRELVAQSIKHIEIAANDETVKATEHGKNLTQVVKIARKDKHASWKKPRIGDCNEKSAFGQLTMSVKAHVDLGCSTHQEAEENWQQFRNELAHMALPDGVTAAWVYVPEFPTYESCKEVTKAKRPFYRNRNKKWQCDVDRLTQCVPEIAEWVYSEIVKCEDEIRLRDILTWMTGDEPDRRDLSK
jgi:hypothetical protein